ncbi:hypothetical protein Bbelb_362410 [Branchiostoma belcheri]|nr:hypothetical protein Bbelb_362410 [Branchiostoma belcheri]
MGLRHGSVQAHNAVYARPPLMFLKGPTYHSESFELHKILRAVRRGQFSAPAKFTPAPPTPSQSLASLDVSSRTLGNAPAKFGQCDLGFTSGCDPHIRLETGVFRRERRDALRTACVCSRMSSEGLHRPTTKRTKREMADHDSCVFLNPDAPWGLQFTACPCNEKRNKMIFCKLPCGHAHEATGHNDTH